MVRLYKGSSKKEQKGGKKMWGKKFF
jgi:hypothetical protein